MIAERHGTGDASDLLGILMTARSEEDHHGMADSEITDKVLGMITGGHETSSSALTWLWYELNQIQQLNRN